MTKNDLLVLTIGHSTRPIEDFIDLLKANHVARVVDVRTIPKSRHNPQYNSDALEASLRGAGIGYTHLKELGGLRKTSPDSPNMGWHNESFRGFADYMQTPDFAQGLDTLLDMARRERIAIMCAEAVPWRCHRSLIADALTVRGVRVEHIINKGDPQPHKITPFAHVDGLTITYPPDPTENDSSR